MPRCEHYDYCYSYVIKGMTLCLKKYVLKKFKKINKNEQVYQNHKNFD